MDVMMGMIQREQVKALLETERVNFFTRYAILGSVGGTSGRVLP